MVEPVSLSLAAVLPFICDKLADTAVIPLGDKLTSWSRDRKTQQQIETSIKSALVAVKNVYPYFDRLLEEEALIGEICKLAVIPPLLLEPDYGTMLDSCWRITADPRTAKDALADFVNFFREQWQRQPAFQQIRESYELIQVREHLAGLQRAMQYSAKEMQSIAKMMSAGVPTFAATPHLPNALLLRAYLDQLVLSYARPGSIPRDVTGASKESPAGVLLLDPSPELSSAPEPFETVLSREQKIVLLGEPGIGKTETLRCMACIAAQSALGSLSSRAGMPDIPIYLELKFYNGEADLEELLAEAVDRLVRIRHLALHEDRTERTRVMNLWLRDPESHFLLLLDGLNEVPRQHHLSIRQSLGALLSYPHRIVLSCRDVDYDESLSERCRSFLLRGLDPSVIRESMERSLGKEGRALFEDVINTDRRMLTLASNPLLLELLLTVAKVDPHHALPTNYGRLLRRFVADMPRRRARESVPATVPNDVVVTTLEEIAALMKKESELTSPLGSLRNQVGTGAYSLDEVLATALAWRLLKSNDPVEFIHPLFQDYFAAGYLATKLDLGGNINGLLNPIVTLGEWYESIVMLVDLSGRPAELVGFLSERLLGGEMMSAADKHRFLFLLVDSFNKSAACENSEVRGKVAEALRTAARSPEMRLIAFRLLNAVDEVSAAVFLNAALESPDANMRMFAVGQFEHFYDPERAIGALARVLGDEDREVRLRVFDYLHKSGEAALAELIASLSSGKRLQAVGAQELLLKLGKPAVAPLIALIRGQGQKDAHCLAAAALGALGDHRAAEPLLQLLNSPDARLRSASARALAAIGVRLAVEPVIGLLDDKDVAVRLSAAESLIVLGRVPPIAGLTALLNHSEPDVRSSAVRVLAQIDAVGACEALVGVLKEDPDKQVREATAYGLASYGDLAADALKEALGDAEFYVRKAAAIGLWKIHSARTLEVLAEAWRLSSLRYVLLAAMRQHVLPDILPYLTAAVEDTDPEVRRLAADIVWDEIRRDEYNLNGSIVRNLIPTLLKDQDEMVCNMAITIVWHLRMSEDWIVGELERIASTARDEGLRQFAAEVVDSVRRRTEREH